MATVDDIKMAIQKSRDLQLPELQIQIALDIKPAGIHPVEGLSQLFADQLHIIHNHLQDIRTQNLQHLPIVHRTHTHSHNNPTTPYRTPSRTPSRKPKRTPSQTPNSYPKTVPKHRHINIQYISPSIGNSWKLSHQSFDSFLMNCMRWATHLPRHPAQHLSHHLVQMPIQGIPTDKLRTTQNGNRPVTSNSINTKIRICLTSHNPNRQMPMHGHWCGPSYKSRTERKHAV